MYKNIYELVTEAKKSTENKINVSDDNLDNPTDDNAPEDFGQDMPDDPDITVDNNEDDPEVKEDDNTSSNNSNNTNINVSDDNLDNPTDDNAPEDFGQDMPDETIDENGNGQSADNNPPPDQNNQNEPIENNDPNADNNEPAETGNDETSDTGINISDDNLGGNAATVTTGADSNNVPDAGGTEDFGEGMPDAESIDDPSLDDDSDIEDMNSPSQDANTNDEDNPDVGSGDNASNDVDLPDDDSGEAGTDDGLGDPTDTDDDLTSNADANAMSQMSNNGEDPEKITELDKKNNDILLRDNFVSLYQEVENFIDRINNANKSSVLASTTYAQVKENLTKIKDFLLKYITMYYDDSEPDINLYNFNYILQMLQINLDMIRIVNDTNDKLEIKHHEKKVKKPKVIKEGFVVSLDFLH